MGITAGIGDQLGLQWRPLLRLDGLLQQPVAVGRLAAAEHDQRGLRQPQLPPGVQLPVDRPVVPLHEERTAGRDLAFAVAAVVDHQVDAAAFPLPLLRHRQLEGPFAGTDHRLGGVGAMGEGAQPGAGRVLA